MKKSSFQDRFKLDDEVMKISRICLVVFFTFIGFGIFAPIDELGCTILNGFVFYMLRLL